MASAISPALSESDIAAIISRPKFWHGDLDWNESPTGSELLVAGANLVDESGATIPGLTAELRHLRRPTEQECNDRFTIFQLTGNRKNRAYQIEVRPTGKLSHFENGIAWYGPHQHFGHQAVQFDAAELPLGADHQAWFYTFVNKANIAFTGNYRHPDPQRTFFS